MKQVSFVLTSRKPKMKLKGRMRRLDNDKAPAWVIKHRGKPDENMLKRYRKYFGADWECAIAELKVLGVKLEDLYLSRLRATISRDFQNEKKRTPIDRWEFDSYHAIEFDSDENFAYIAAYTPGGSPSGVTCDEMDEQLESEYLRRQPMYSEFAAVGDHAWIAR